MRRLLDALVANQPAAYPIATLDGHLDLRTLSRPLEDIVADAYGWGIVDLHIKPPILTIGPPERPVASPLARLHQPGTLQRQQQAIDAFSRKSVMLRKEIDPARIRADMAEAGWERVELETVNVQGLGVSATAFAAGFALGSPLAHELAARGADPDAVVHALNDALVPIAGGQPFKPALAATVITAVR